MPESQNKFKQTIKIVLDTNVLVSSLITKKGNCTDIIKLVTMQKIQLYYSSEIFAEYKRVLAYQKLSFTSHETNPLLNIILKQGIAFETSKSTIEMIDESDRKFYDLHKASGAILITGNIKHFPKEDSIMLVYATEGYAKRHGISEKEAFGIFKEYGISDYFRKYYGVLHTQDFDEDVFFAEDLIERAKEKSLRETGR